jgi:hypothetical protein
MGTLGGSSRPPQRRGEGGSRREASDRVVLRAGARSLSGWMLNVSRGGLRVVVEEPLSLGEEFEAELGDAEGCRPVRVVWLRTQTDGDVAGLQFLDAGSAPPPEPE